MRDAARRTLRVLRRDESRREQVSAFTSRSGSMIFSCSMTEPGQPWVTIIGSAFWCFDFTWMKWISSPSICVMKCGSDFRCASHLLQA
jgi:hypothetical protein